MFRPPERKGFSGEETSGRPEGSCFYFGNPGTKECRRPAGGVGVGGGEIRAAVSCQLASARAAEEDGSRVANRTINRNKLLLLPLPVQPTPRSLTLAPHASEPSNLCKSSMASRPAVVAWPTVVGWPPSSRRPACRFASVRPSDTSRQVRADEAPVNWLLCIFPAATSAAVIVVSHRFDSNQFGSAIIRRSQS